MDYEQIKKAAESYRADMTRFLRAMISPPQRELRGEGSGGLHQGRDGEAGLRRGGGRRPGQRHRLDG